MSMDITKLPNNSNAVKNKPQAPAAPQASTDKKQKVVKGAVTTKKKSEVRKFTEVFVAEDAGSVWDHLLHEMVIPMTKNLLVDFGQAFIERMITGTSRGSSRGVNLNNPPYTSYSSISTNNNIRYANPGTTVTRFDYEDITFTTAGDANAVLDQLDFFTRKYGLARVSDFYDVCGLTAPPTAHNYGWTNLNRARVISVHGGFALELPKAAVLD